MVPDDTALNLAPDVFMTAFENAPVGIGVCNEAGLLIAVNRFFARLVDRRRREMIGRPFLGFVHPASRSRCLARYFESVVASDTAAAGPQHADLRLMSNRTVWAAVSWTVNRYAGLGNQYAIVHLTEITADHQRRVELAEVRQRALLAFMSSPIGGALLTLDGSFIETNPALQRMLGYSAPELGELNLCDIAHPDERTAWRDLLDGLTNGTHVTAEVVRRHPRHDGRVIIARSVISGLSGADDAMRYLVLHMEDISGERRARDELRRWALRDPLTGLVSAEGLAYELDLSTAPRMLIVIDVLGVGPADAAELPTPTISAVAARIAANTKTDDLVARIGANRFGILIDPISQPSVERLMTRVCDVITEPIAVDGREHSVVADVRAIADMTGQASLKHLLRRLAEDPSPTPPEVP